MANYSGITEEIINPSFSQDSFDIMNGMIDAFFVSDIKLKNMRFCLGGIHNSFEVASRVR